MKAFFMYMLAGIALLVVGLFVREVLKVNQPVYGDYTANVSVDKPEKILPALSNAVRRVESKGFAVVGVHVWKEELFTHKVFNITVRGADEATILKLDD